jgi:pimeloyl-ACP methyl ester carboxylesterase
VSSILRIRDVVFLPGIIAPAAVRYGPLIECLVDVNPLLKDLEVYSSDSPPPDYSIAMEVAGVNDAADAVGFDKFHLYAHSGGAAVALAYAAEHPERVLSLAVDEPAYDFTEEARADMEEFAPLAALPIDERLRAFMQLQVSASVELPPPPAGPPPPWMANRPAGIEAFIVALDRHERLDDRHRAVGAPVLYTWGSRTHPRWDVMQERLARLFSDFTAERFEGLHHLNTSHQAAPDRVGELLLELWARADLAR